MGFCECGSQCLVGAQTHPPPVLTQTKVAVSATAPAGHDGHRSGGGRGETDTHLQSSPELTGLPVPRPLLYQIHLGLNALPGVESDPVPLPVVHLCGRQQAGEG